MKLVHPNLLDRTIRFFSPKTALKRLIARQKAEYFRYDAARSSRDRGIAPALIPSENSSNQSDRLQLIRQMQDLANNNGFVRSILLKIAVYVCGSIRYQSRTGDREIDKQYEQYFSDWCNSCDITGRHNFTQLMWLAMYSMIRDGDMAFLFVRERDLKGNPVGQIKLQSIEADRLGGNLYISVTDNYFGGITIDNMGKPVTYRIYKRNPNGVYSDPVEYGSRDVVHFFDPMRLDQYRGVTAFHACIEDLRDIHEILSFEKVAVKWASSHAGVIWTELGEQDMNLDLDSTSQSDINGNAMQLEAIEQGALTRLSPGERMEQFKNDRPSSSFTGFLPVLYREIALSLGLPYGFVYDMAAFGGVNARLDSAQAQRAFERYQFVLESKVLSRIKNVVLADAIQTKALPFNDKWMRGKFMFPAHITADVGRESRANLDENKQGLKTAADIFAEQGKDWEEEIEQIAIEESYYEEMAKKYDVPIERIRVLNPNAMPTDPNASNQIQEINRLLPVRR